MQAIPYPSWVYNITVCSMVQGLLWSCFVWGVSLLSTTRLSTFYGSFKIPCQCHAGGPDSYFVYCTVLPWLQKSCWAPNTSTVLYYACVATKFLLESLLIVHSISQVFIPKNLASLLMSLGDIVCVSVDLSFVTLEWCTGCGSIAWINCFNSLGRMRLAHEEHEYRTGSR